jgi:hypothetical protein
MGKASEECQGPSGAVESMMIIIIMIMIIVEAITVQVC